MLQEELDRLDRLAREFSEFSRLPEGTKAPVDIGELLDSVVPATVPETVPVLRQTDEELVVQGHYEPLRRAVQNLLQNAVEATSARGIEVKASRVGDLGAGTRRLSIADHGPGVPSSQRDQIFEPYFTTKETGTGLGLAIVRQTIVAHGGTIAVEDTLDGGATFMMELPERS
ncbi:MAG: HAMP domain-containing histidine kinase [Gemmatimonadetes bacterium]|nr:HAMP domain-containing histidine kinase [Gemmatimonadota bacterium]